MGAHIYITCHTPVTVTVACFLFATPL